MDLRLLVDASEKVAPPQAQVSVFLAARQTPTKQRITRAIAKLHCRGGLGEAIATLAVAKILPQPSAMYFCGSGGPSKVFEGSDPCP